MAAAAIEHAALEREYRDIAEHEARMRVLEREEAAHEATILRMNAVRALADAKRARKVFELAAAKKKAVIYPLVLLMLMVYPAMIGFALAAKIADFALLIPTSTTPNSPTGALGGRLDAWNTMRPDALARTAITFTCISFGHIVLVSYLRIRGDRGAPKMTPCYVWFVPIAFWLCTVNVFLTLTTISWYGASRTEWGIFFGFSCFLALVTLVLLRDPIRAAGVIEEEE